MTRSESNIAPVLVHDVNAEEKELGIIANLLR